MQRLDFSQKPEKHSGPGIKCDLHPDRPVRTGESTAVIGAGPAGLCAAHELCNNGRPVSILEMNSKVGGIARTETYRGFLFDIGGHRYHSHQPEVVQLWKDLLGPELLRVPRSSRIFFQGRFVSYPLQASDLVSVMSLPDCIGIVASYLKARMAVAKQPDNLEDWLIRRFGQRLYQAFFKQYTEKVWGRSCREIKSDWAPQRIQGLSVGAILLKALGIPSRKSATLISHFYYPRLGAGMMWEAMHERITELGGQIRLQSKVKAVQHDQSGVTGLQVQCGQKEYLQPAGQVISSIPLPLLIKCLQPTPPTEVLTAAERLQFRSLIMVGLILDSETISADQWIYVHDPGCQVGRIQVFKNWSPDMVPNESQSSLGMEYFCSKGDELWQRSDAELGHLAAQELQRLFPGLGDKVSDSVVYRIPHAYPIYSLDYKDNLKTVRDYIDSVPGLYTIGRNGLHRYNNMDHSMLSGMQAASALLRKSGSMEKAAPAGGGR